jgi:hypothetical protein
MSANEAWVRDGVAAFNSDELRTWLAVDVHWTGEPRGDAPPVDMPMGVALRLRESRLTLMVAGPECGGRARQAAGARGLSPPPDTRQQRSMPAALRASSRSM